MEIQLKDGSFIEVDEGASALDVAKKLSEGLARNAVCAKVNGKLVDLDTELQDGCNLEIVTLKDRDGVIVLRHSTAHVLAEAVKELYPTCKIAIGPANDDGFFYEFDFQNNICEADLEKIEKQMAKIIKADEPFTHKVVSRKQALEIMKEQNQPYKVELIEQIPDGEVITMYSQGNFIDVCRGPHIPRTGMIKAFKLTRIAGAYWKGDEKNKMLTRVYGTAFASKADMDQYFAMIEEAKKRDHRKLGRELELFFFDETAPGMAYWLPKGLTLMNTLIDFWRKEHRMRGYQEFSAPQLNSSVLWKTSGHWAHYKDDMFVLTDADGNEQALKPMSCPNSIKVYQQKIRSYKDLPLRYNDVDVIHRNEKSGQLNGLFRVRMFRQDDSHNFIRQDQIGSEIASILDIAKKFYGIFNLPYELTLSTRPEDFMGDIESWNEAETELKKVLDEICGKDNYKINEGDGAFYGPKIDIKMKDSLGRNWQMGTIQLDFQLPRRFDLSYVDENGNKVPPIMVHRVIYGSLERFIGIITENFAGAFPTWLAPVQVKVMNVSEKSEAFASEIYNVLEDNDIRSELDIRGEKISYKIREATMNKIPYLVIVGENEVANGTVSVRKRGTQETVVMTIADFVAKVKDDVKTKTLD